MPPPIHILGVLYALASAIVWGGGDFTGGVATRRSSQFHVLAVSALSGLVLLCVCAWLRHETLPGPSGLLWGLLAGIAGAVGIAALYRALSVGQAALVAPTSGVLAAALPVAIGVLVHGIPAPARLAGLTLALPGIALAAGASAGAPAGAASQARISLQRGFRLACLAGLGFGCFFVFIAQVGTGAIFTPLIVARAVQLAVALLMIRAYRLPPPSLTGNPFALLAGVLDAGGNIFYVLATQFVRLEVAAVLSSFYPASTVLLAAVLLKERVVRSQVLGLGICLLAIVLISA